MKVLQARLKPKEWSNRLFRFTLHQLAPRRRPVGRPTALPSSPVSGLYLQWALRQSGSTCQTILSKWVHVPVYWTLWAELGISSPEWGCRTEVIFCLQLVFRNKSNINYVKGVENTRLWCAERYQYCCHCLYEIDSLKFRGANGISFCCNGCTPNWAWDCFDKLVDVPLVCFLDASLFIGHLGMLMHSLWHFLVTLVIANYREV